MAAQTSGTATSRTAKSSEDFELAEKKTYRLGVLGTWAGHESVLVDYTTVDDELLWVRSDGFFPVPDNCDLPVKRYQLRKNKITGKESFWPVVHERDEAEENTAPSATVNPAFIARALLNLSQGKTLSKADQRKLEEYLKTMDAKGATKQ